MKKYVIEREIPKVGTLEREQLRQAAAKSNEALRQLGPDIQWLESFVAADKTFCVYLAKMKPSFTATQNSAASRRLKSRRSVECSILPRPRRGSGLPFELQVSRRDRLRVNGDYADSSTDNVFQRRYPECETLLRNE